MSQHDLDIANQTASQTRVDLNLAFKALGSTSSGISEPTTSYPNQLWYDTDNHILKLKAEVGGDWINIGYFDQSADAFRILDDTQVVNTSGTQTGLLGDQTTATWETGTGTTESLVSPAKVKAAILANFSDIKMTSDTLTSAISKNEAQINSGDQTYVTVTLPSGAPTGNYALSIYYNFIASASGSDNNWQATTQIKKGTSVLFSRVYRASSSNNSSLVEPDVNYSKSLSCSAGDSFTFIIKQNNSNDISDATLNAFNFTLTGPYESH